MGVKRTYRGLPEVNLASYDFYDLSTGTGYKTFYGIDVNAPNVADYLLTTQTIYAMNGFTSSYQAATDIDFDLSLEVPLTIGGNAIINVPVSSSSDLSSGIVITAIIYKVDAAAAETQLGAVSGSLVMNNSAEFLAGNVDIPTIRLKAGEKLRLNITAPSPGATKYLYIHHDPKNRLDLQGPAPTTSQLSINLPIKI